MSKRLGIGTRESELATWQAEHVQEKLQKNGIDSELKFISSQGDKDTETPLTEMGGVGVFTKALDEALMDDQIDIAVHSYKDLPTKYPLPLKVAAVLERGDPRDALFAPRGIDFLDDPDYEATIATGSNRRQSQWLSRFPKHQMTGLRGNVNTRIEKVRDAGWDGAIFAAAGLQRMGLDDHIHKILDWMVPAPAQGAIAVHAREEDEAALEALAPLNDPDTELCTRLERDFLYDMEAGCSAPVGAWGWIDGKDVHLRAVALSLDGRQRYETTLDAPKDQAKELGHNAARRLLDEGAAEVVAEHRNKN